MKADYKATFEQQVYLIGLPALTKEVVFAPPRKWRFDYAYPDLMIAVEYQGGNYGGGRGGHNSVSGLKRDYEKFTEAALLGWTLILIDASTVNSGMAVEWLERARAIKGANVEKVNIED